MFLSYARTRVQWPIVGAAIAAVWFTAAPASARETRSYVISWFSQAVSNTDGDCAGGINPDILVQARKDLSAVGMTPDQAEETIRLFVEAKAQEVFRETLNSRGRIDGKPVNAYANPLAVVDPKLNSVTGKIAYGFNLDGKGADDPNAFVDPDTHERGVDNEAFRALGCSRAFRGTKDNSGAYWAFIWVTIKDSMPAWLMSVSGDDLSKDGPVTIAFDRALEYAKSNPNGQTRPFMTYRVDPSPRSHNEFRGEIRNGVLNIAEPGKFSMAQSFMYAPAIDLTNTHLRMTMRDDGGLDGFIGGYQPWRDIYFGLGWGGTASEETTTGEIPGLFYLLRKFADANPDPKTGQNRDISVAYRMQAVPAFHVRVDDKPQQVSAR